MKKIFLNILALVIVGTTLTSCLKDDTAVLDPEKAGANIIEFSNPTDIAVKGSTTALYVMAFPITPTDTQIPITINYAGAESGAPQDITVNVGLGDLATLTQYNTEQSTNLTLMDANTYSISAESVVIPKGKKTASFTVSVKTSLFNLTRTYGLPLKIKSVSSGTISTNFSNIILNVAAKNKYDGKYQFIATQSATDRPTFLIGTQYTYPYNVQLRTTGPNSVNLYNEAFGDFLIPLITSTNGVSGLGSTNLEFVFDPATNKVLSAANKIVAGNGRTMSLDASVNATSNFWDPATKELKVTFFMNQPGFTPLKYTAQLKYIGSR